MFSFVRDDRVFQGSSAAAAAINQTTNKLAPHRMTGLKHNPYVGTFFNVNYHLDEAADPAHILSESKNNPLVGVFRHSPSVIGRSLGLKVCVMAKDAPSSSAPVVSRLQHKPPNLLPLSKRNFVASLKQIPVTRFSALSSSARSVGSAADVPAAASPLVTTDSDSAAELGSLAEPAPGADNTLPVCAICLEVYADGDEILTLACSHCYHSECASRWFFQHCLNSSDVSSAFSCPQCRQDHIALSEISSQSDSDFATHGISAQSFLALGQTLAQDGGYDFLSDTTSEPPTSVNKPPLAPRSAPKMRDEDEGSVWSDCGVPLSHLAVSPNRRK